MDMQFEMAGNKVTLMRRRKVARSGYLLYTLRQVSQRYFPLTIGLNAARS